MRRLRHSGFSLIELMIAMLVLTTGVVGSIAIQSTAKKNTFDATQRAQASALVHDIIERIRGNKSQLSSYAGTDYGAKTFNDVKECHKTEETSSSTVSCTPAELATYDTYQWDALLKGTHVTKSTTSDGTTTSSNVGGLINPTGCIIVTKARNEDNTADLQQAGSVTVVVSWTGRFTTKDANDSDGYDCGGSSTNKQRRQVSVTAYIF
ncbi:type IV pilus modification protein PilV [Saccharobesus litoralis]|uniref:Type IV pilus modification protein PilV n=1 Tax=Saccharobesus litoralis TaxID=2172099 RepID=A0A2S0VWE3_9ALTE|nr:type IV pilus modification protein PilV [Saccharobesus litoralis]AWB68539.1 type IV pilus modification protein PilV [Saccharobesus litoralis]